MAEYKRGYGGKVEFSSHSIKYHLSTTTTAVYKGECRLAGFHLGGLTASAANRVTVKIYDGTASNGTLFLDLANTTIHDTYLYPFVQFDTGIFVDISGSATGLTQCLSVFYLKDDDRA